MLCASPWEAFPFLSGDGEEDGAEGVNGKGKGQKERRDGELVGMLNKWKII